ncbi:MAG: hypothetical protein M3512_06355 [Bacteroidota bacterium]|nr:hypothetical protein [Bacteroidota bacterium]
MQHGSNNIINIKQQQEFDAIHKELSFLNKDDILTGFFNSVQKFLIKSNYPIANLGLKKYGWTDLKKIPAKDALINIVPILYNDKGVMEAFLNSLSEIEQKLLKKAVWHQDLNKKDLEEIYGMPVLMLQERWSNYLEIDLVPVVKKDWGKFITLQKPYGYFNDREGLLKNSDLKFSFPTVLKRLYSMQLPKPAGYDFQPLSSVNTDWETFDFEKDIFQVFPMLLAYVMQGAIKFSQKGYLNKSSVKKMSKSLKLTEFSTADPYFIRTLMLAGFMGSKIKTDAINTPIMKSLERLFLVDLKLKNTVPFMMPHLKGLNYFASHQFNINITQRIWGVFQQLPSKEWISFQNLKTYVTCRFIQLIPLNSWEIVNRVEVEQSINIEGYVETEFIRLNELNIFQFVGLPYLAAHVYFMASWGLMEIAVDSNAPMNGLPFDQLAAFRLTPLGAYLLGLAPQYTPPKDEAKTTLTFDETSLFIRIEGNTAIGDTLLNKFANKVSENRYQFSSGKFLKEITNTRNLVAKINLFKQTIGQELPPYWADYLRKLVENSKQIKSRSNVVVFTLPPDNREMHRHVAQDELLRKITIKAEKYQLIVEKKDMLTFSQRMKDFGYLVDNYLLV